MQKKETVKKLKPALETLELEDKKEVYRVGRFYIAVVKNEKGMKGVGISRRSSLDMPNDSKGKGIAVGRAMKALRMKESGLTMGGNNPFLG
jgi:predicted RNA-binding protein with PUA domain